MAKAYLEDARYSLSEAKGAHKAGIYHRSVRRAQECIELSLKAVLRLIGVEYPRQHDVSVVLQEIAERKGLPNLVRREPSLHQAIFTKKTTRKEQ